MKIRKIPIIRRTLILKGMDKLHDVLSNSPLHNRCWLCGGILLGYAREGRILKGDSDVDLHFWHEDQDKFETTAKLLINAGFKPRYRWRNQAGEITEYVFSWQGIKFEFFEAYCINNNTRWYSYGGGIRNGLPVLEMLNETPGCDLEEFDLFGKRWLKPADHETYLSALYGDWKTPNPNYVYYKDSKAVISRKPLPGRVPW